ncbi:hypothetical protein, partial [Brevibacterium aurantiacum]|uniref:hypothetical protein n=1 Tax=Brevibacterium aurantiacum TaxID=273384 RepID=UPI001C69F7C6
MDTVAQALSDRRFDHHHLGVPASGDADDAALGKIVEELRLAQVPQRLIRQRPGHRDHFEKRGIHLS